MVRPWTGNGQFCSAINCNNRRKICSALSFFRFPVNEERYVYWVKRYNYDIMLKKSGFTLFNSGTVCIDTGIQIARSDYSEYDSCLLNGSV